MRFSGIYFKSQHGSNLSSQCVFKFHSVIPQLLNNTTNIYSFLGKPAEAKIIATFTAHSLQVCPVFAGPVPSHDYVSVAMVVSMSSPTFPHRDLWSNVASPAGYLKALSLVIASRLLIIIIFILEILDRQDKINLHRACPTCIPGLPKSSDRARTAALGPPTSRGHYHPWLCRCSSP